MIWIVLVTVSLAALFLIAMYFNFRELATTTQKRECATLNQPLNKTQLDALTDQVIQRLLTRMTTTESVADQNAAAGKRSAVAPSITEQRDNIIPFKNNHIAEDMRNVG